MSETTTHPLTLAKRARKGLRRLDKRLGEVTWGFAGIIAFATAQILLGFQEAIPAQALPTMLALELSLLLAVLPSIQRLPKMFSVRLALRLTVALSVLVVITTTIASGRQSAAGDRQATRVCLTRVARLGPDTQSHSAIVRDLSQVGAALCTEISAEHS